MLDCRIKEPEGAQQQVTGIIIVGVQQAAGSRGSLDLLCQSRSDARPVGLVTSQANGNAKLNANVVKNGRFGLNVIDI